MKKTGILLALIVTILSCQTKEKQPDIVFKKYNETAVLKEQLYRDFSQTFLGY
ncbi:hypothetical protein [Polaribacter septentrionalilitoris]|uniref:hypothetical protein n=1 Tax=Polaribacter septentrionalilitoris TaxID=2494657 RepID=UPI001356E6F5|nr:hypothetical protein [Polaribacter septentrionalilitoris]